jgi:NADPH:quinone reductase-like Zn-dependent oxidoreductase
MKAVYLTEHGGIEQLTYGDLQDPIPQANEVVVHVHACGLNHMDIWLRRGLPFLKVSFPFILGMDIAGEVAAVGAGVEDLPIGTRVVINPGVSCGRCPHCLAGRDNLCARYQMIGEQIPGGYAQLVKIPAQNLVPLPAEVSFEAAACIPVVFSTAWNMVFEKAQVRPGEWVLIQAGGSGVGSAAIQLAKMMGATVITTAGSDEKLAQARSLGADYGVNYTTQDFLHAVRRITNKRGVDVVIEHLGGEVWERSLLCLVSGGRLISCGATLGHHVKTDLRHVFFRNLKILGATMASKARLLTIIQLVQAGKLQPVLDRVLPLQQAREAHQALEQHRQFGKLVLAVE